MKAYQGVDEKLYAFLTSALDGGEWLASCPGRFTTRENALLYPFNRWLGGPQSRPQCFRHKNSLVPAGNQTVSLRSPSPQLSHYTDLNKYGIHRKHFKQIVHTSMS